MQSVNVYIVLNAPGWDICVRRSSVYLRRRRLPENTATATFTGRCSPDKNSDLMRGEDRQRVRPSSDQIPHGSARSRRGSATGWVGPTVGRLQSFDRAEYDRRSRDANVRLYCCCCCCCRSFRHSSFGRHSMPGAKNVPRLLSIRADSLRHLLKRTSCSQQRKSFREDKLSPGRRRRGRSGRILAMSNYIRIFMGQQGSQSDAPSE